MLPDEIPIVYKDVCKCYYIEKLYPGRGEPGIVICTVDGFLIKFVKGIVKAICEIQCKNAESVTGFCSYEPFHKYYVVKADDEIVIVDGGESFQVCKRYSCVSKFGIRDFTGEGVPQLRIWRNNSKEFEIFNCGNNTTGSSVSQNAIENVLCVKIQELKMKFEESQHELETKIKLRHQAIQNIQATMEENSSQFLNKNKENSDVILPVQLNYTWVRAFEGVFVVGACVRNISNWLVTEVNLVLQPSQSTLLLYKTSLYIYEDEFKRLVDLPPESQGWIVGVLDMSEFPEHSLNLGAHVTYSFKNEDKCITGNQLIIPDFSFNMDSYISGSNVPFSKCKEISEVDVLSAISSCETTILTTKHVTSSANYIESAMKSQLKFEKVFRDFYFNYGTELPPLSGMLLNMKGDAAFRVYYRNKKQLDIFRHCISSVPGVKLLDLNTGCSSEANVQEVAKALHDELECVNDFMKEMIEKQHEDINMSGNGVNNISNDSEFEIPSTLYYAFRKKLSSLETKTDLLLYGEINKNSKEDS